MMTVMMTTTMLMINMLIVNQRFDMTSFRLMIKRWFNLVHLKWLPLKRVDKNSNPEVWDLSGEQIGDPVDDLKDVCYYLNLECYKIYWDILLMMANYIGDHSSEGAESILLAYLRYF